MSSKLHAEVIAATNTHLPRPSNLFILTCHESFCRASSHFAHSPPQWCPPPRAPRAGKLTARTVTEQSQQSQGRRRDRKDICMCQHCLRKVILIVLQLRFCNCSSSSITGSSNPSTSPKSSLAPLARPASTTSYIAILTTFSCPPKNAADLPMPPPILPHPQKFKRPCRPAQHRRKQALSHPSERPLPAQQDAAYNLQIPQPTSLHGSTPPFAPCAKHCRPKEPRRTSSQA